MNTSCIKDQRRITKVEWEQLRWDSVSNRIVSARFNSRYTKLTIITTNEAEERIKD